MLGITKDFTKSSASIKRVKSGMCHHSSDQMMGLSWDGKTFPEIPTDLYQSCLHPRITLSLLHSWLMTATAALAGKGYHSKSMQQWTHGSLTATELHRAALDGSTKMALETSLKHCVEQAEVFLRMKTAR